ncbi:MAG: type IV secretion system DNA-binding domain-containing protein [Patescibacteria group bacterium]|nr:type IV secretion system DNA-binding domain-containing protein [Patescibacteria group bacterium]
MDALKLRLLSIKLAKKYEKAEKDDWVKEVNLSGQLVSILVNLKVPFSFESAVNYIGEEIFFYVAVPGDSMQFVMRQIQGLWPDAQVEEVDDYNIFNNAGFSTGVYFKQKQNSVLPIRTFEEAQTDTFLPILSDLSKIESLGEGVALQVLIKPGPKQFKKNALRVIEKLKKGKKFEDAIKVESVAITMKDIDRAFNPQKNKKESTEPLIVDEEAVKVIEKKLSKPIFSVNVRLIVSAPSQFRAEEMLSGLVGSFDQFSAPLRNELKPNKPRNQSDFIFKYIFREFDDGQAMTLGTDELTSIFHLPTSLTEIPRVKWIKFHEVPPPSNLPKEGVLIGKSIFRKEERMVYISEEDRRRHIYVIGQTGTGKSVLIKNMADSDVLSGKGFAIIDPHGDLVDDILDLIPENRRDDVIIFDPSDLMRPIGLNMLEYDLDRPEQKTFIVNEILGIFDKLYDLKATGGPMFEQYLRQSLLLLMGDAKYEVPTLMDVPRIFADPEYRQAKLERCQDSVVKDFWEKEALAAGGEASLQNITPYITSKFTSFTSNDYMRPIISQSRSTLNFREIMDSGKILLVNLSKGRIGDLNASLLGMIIVGKILMAAFGRADIPLEKRKDFNLYIDEFQNFTTDSIVTILSEARKYRLNLIIAHQFIAQLQEKIRDSVFGNVGSIIAFRVGPNDAEFLEKQFSPIFTKNDLMNMDNFNAYVKIMINNETSKPFNIKTIPPAKGNPAIREEIKNLSRMKYGTERHEV